MIAALHCTRACRVLHSRHRTQRAGHSMLTGHIGLRDEAEPKQARTYIQAKQMRRQLTYIQERIHEKTENWQGRKHGQSCSTQGRHSVMHDMKQKHPVRHDMSTQKKKQAGHTGRQDIPADRPWRQTGHMLYRRQDTKADGKGTRPARHAYCNCMQKGAIKTQRTAGHTYRQDISRQDIQYMQAKSMAGMTYRQHSRSGHTGKINITYT
jgi:hypothetical protein